MIKKILVAGAPASGKTTLVNLWSDMLTRKGITSRIIDDYQVLLETCPRSKVSKDYYYDDGGALILRDEYREKVMSRQYELLSKKWWEEYNGVVFLELANPNLSMVMERYFPLGDEGLLLVVKCGIEKSKERNRLREVGRQIPDSFIGMFNLSSDESEQKAVELNRGRIIENLGGYEDYLRKLRGFYYGFFEE